MNIIDDLPPAERRAVAVMAFAIQIYGGTEGTGLFSGVGRYTVLHQRSRLAASCSRTVREFLDRLCRLMSVIVQALPLIDQAKSAGASRRDVFRGLTLSPRLCDKYGVAAIAGLDEQLSPFRARPCFVVAMIIA